MLHMQAEIRQVRENTATLVCISSKGYVSLLKQIYSAKCAKKGVTCLGYSKSFECRLMNDIADSQKENL